MLRVVFVLRSTEILPAFPDLRAPLPKLKLCQNDNSGPGGCRACQPLILQISKPAPHPAAFVWSKPSRSLLLAGFWRLLPLLETGLPNPLVDRAARGAEFLQKEWADSAFSDVCQCPPFLELTGVVATVTQILPLCGWRPARYSGQRS